MSLMFPYVGNEEKSLGFSLLGVLNWWGSFYFLAFDPVLRNYFCEAPLMGRENVSRRPLTINEINICKNCIHVPGGHTRLLQHRVAPPRRPTI